MNQNDCERLVNSYVDWLKSGLSIDVLENACELTTPFLDRHNDHLQIYAVRKNGKIFLSDDGYVLSDLKASGVDMWTPKRKNILETTLRGFGVQTDGAEIRVEASTENLGQRVHALLQAMLAVNDMFVMAQARVFSFFLEDVKSFLDEHDIRYSPRVKISGRSGYDHAIDFVIPKSKNRPERFIKTINTPTKNSIVPCLFALEEAKAARENGTLAYAFLNDSANVVPGDVAVALRQYEVHAVAWSSRMEYRDELAA